MKQRYNKSCVGSIALLFITLTAALLLIFMMLYTKNEEQCQNVVKTEALSDSAIVKVGWFTISIGEGYFEIAEQQILNTEMYFCTRRPYIRSEYFIFTDRKVVTPDLQHMADRIHLIYRVKQGWPADTESRYAWMDDAIDKFELSSTFTYLYWQDADNWLEGDQCEDVLGTLVGVKHGHTYLSTQKYNYESRPQSKAYVPSENSAMQPYFSAHIYGGLAQEFKNLVHSCSEWTTQDHAVGIQAQVDDESYLNAYFYQNHPTVTLGNGFVWNDGYNYPWMKREKHMGTAIIKSKFHANRTREKDVEK